ncbi:RND efflux transporter [Pseudomonas aeruginosa]|nr:RND efflux transporter [Pseudomonas aeruginosa]
MTFPRFFIDRPIFAIVLSVLMMIGGIVSFFQLPLSEYPAVTPPTVQVTTAYPGANPDVIAQTVATPLEQAITGVEGMLYMSSQSATDGRMILTITFDQHIDPDMAQIQVQNRVSRVLSRLPDEVQRQGVVTQKTSPDILMVVHLLSPEQRYDPLYISNYAYLQVRDELLRLPGISDVVVWGAGEYSMRLWLDPDLIAARGLTAGEVIAAVREQNVQVAAGAVGQAPDSTAAFQVTVNTLGRLSDEEQFGDIIVRTGADGQVTRLRDVARIEMGGDAYALRSLLDGEPAVALQIVQSPGANALDTAEAVRATVARLEGNFPAGLSARIAYDPTVFVRASLQTVATTLLEAILLVVVVVVLFLRSWRASLIPLMAVPVSLVGTFAIMHLMGFSLNTLSLFGLVLSIGIVVDDAIVVVENVERHIENGEPPLQAARRAMDEVTGPIMAITSVLAAVFIPTAFLSGLQGEFYRQFALTIAISTILSALNSLTLSPALAGLLLRPRPAGDAVAGRFQRLLQVLGRPLRNAPEAYGNAVRKVVRVSGLALVVYGGLLGLTWVGFQAVPPGFRADAGQVLSGRHRPVAERSVAGAYRSGGQADVPDRPRRAGGGERRGLPGPVGERLRQRAERRGHVLHARPVRIAHLRRSRRAGHRRAPASQVRQHSRRLPRGLPAAAGTGAGNHRRLQDAGRGSRRRRAGSPGQADPGADDEGH